MKQILNVLLIGGGGREHAIAETIIRTSKDKIFNFNDNEFEFGSFYISPGNPGTKKLGQNVKLDLSNHSEIINFCNQNDIKFVIVGPELPLADGLADSLIPNGILCFGPEKYAANLEASKAFSKDFMQKYGIPTAAYKNFGKSEKSEAIKFSQSLSLPIVIKADGLAAGKGVIIAESYIDAENSINEIFEGMFGASGDNIVIEEFMQGEEASLFAICDGNDYVVLSSAQDHKRIFDGDKGKNTGGMGAYSPAPIVNKKLLEQVKTEVIDKVLYGLKNEGHKYIGCLYVGLMIENNYGKVVEFNSRFGDPETQVVLPLFEGNLLELFYTASAGKIAKSAYLPNNNKSACTVILASNGYPDTFLKGNLITGIDSADSTPDVKVFIAGIEEKDGNYYNTGGRVLAVTAIADNLENAINLVYKTIPKINFANKYYRKDIGKKGLKIIK